MEMAVNSEAYMEVQRQVSELQAERDQLRTQLKQAEARVAELRELVSLFGKLPFNCHDYMTEKQWEKICWIHAEIDDDTSQPWLLRKQAEAVESQAKEWNPEEQTYSGRKPHKELVAEAQRLRQQAEAVEDAANYVVGLGDKRTLLHYVQCLRQQADELEQN